MHSKKIYTEGKPIHEAGKALIMLHGRGAGAEDILRLISHLNVHDHAIFAPQATNNTWYPYSFMANPQQNEPWLSSALELINEIVQEISEQGIAPENIYFLGFSQGACLTLEYVARHAKRYGGVAAFTGGLIGDTINRELYSGHFEGTPIFISTGNPDPHVPLDRVEDTAVIMKEMHAKVYHEVYEGRPHAISPDETDKANQFIFKI